ncbi:UNVERIFIED_CONTAM: hypothetical protein RMT77_016291 [Armadillidium vulgare]
MPAADELYLLSQKSSDLCNNLCSQFQKYFDWLDEVVLSAKEARGETLIPKTPGRKRNKKIVEDIENVPSLLPPPPPPVENVRKSSRAAAKAAHEKTKKTLQEISNIGSKIRRPSTPPQVFKSVEFISILDEKNEKAENSADVSKPTSILEFDLPETPHSEIDDKIEDKNNFEIIDKEKSSSEYSNDDDDMDVKVLPLKDNSPKVEEITKLPYLKLIDISHKDHHQEEDEHKFTKPTRITRTKKRIAETADTAIPVQPEEVVIRNTRSKRRKVEEEVTLSKEDVESIRPVCNEEHLISSQLSCKSTLSDSQPIIVTVNNEPSINQPPENVPLRITRSKVRKINPKTPPSQKEIIDECPPKQSTPVKMNSNSNHLTSKAKIESPILMKNSDSPSKKLKTKKLNNLKPEANKIHNRSIDRNEMCSPLVIKHFRSATMKSGTSTLPRTKSFQTPSPISSSTAKMLGIKQTIFGSAGFQSTYAQKRKPIICSSPQVGGKVISTPTEGSRVKNIVMGPSFLTKVLPNKPSKEETEEKKKEEMRRKREREEEIWRKREEMLKMQRDEKKRKNEERMRKVQESRELKKKKEAEAREMQERERKQREERLKEEKRRKLLELKKIEELKLKKQAEEERRLREEQRLFEEQKAMEELRIAEEKRKLEVKRLQEREAERILREKLEMEKMREEQRIAREKEEIDRLKAKEARNLESEKMNETYTTNTEHPLNTTYSKPAQNSTVQKSEEVQSYEMTPVAEKKKPTKSKSAEDYDINDLRSDDSTDDECAPKKKIPNWAGGNQLRKQLFYQEHYPPDLDVVFPPNVILQMPDLSKIFATRRSRFFKRTSSAVWNTPPYKVLAPRR